MSQRSTSVDSVAVESLRVQSTQQRLSDQLVNGVLGKVYMKTTEPQKPEGCYAAILDSRLGVPQLTQDSDYSNEHLIPHQIPLLGKSSPAT